MINPGGQSRGQACRGFRSGPSERAHSRFPGPERSNRFGLFDSGCNAIDQWNRNAVGDTGSKPRQWGTGQNDHVGIVLGDRLIRELDEELSLLVLHVVNGCEASVEAMHTAAATFQPVPGDALL